MLRASWSILVDWNRELEVGKLLCCARAVNPRKVISTSPTCLQPNLVSLSPSKASSQGQGWRRSRSWAPCVGCHHRRCPQYRMKEGCYPKLVLATRQSRDPDFERMMPLSSFNQPMLLPRGPCSTSCVSYLARTNSLPKTNVQFTKQGRQTVDNKKTKLKQA